MTHKVNPEIIICIDCGRERPRAVGPWCSGCAARHRKRPDFVIPQPPSSKCEECGKNFIPPRWGSRFAKFCSNECRGRAANKTEKRKEYMRNYYKENPEQNEKKREYRKLYWTPEKRAKYAKPKSDLPRVVWNKGLTINDPRVAANVEKAANALRGRKYPLDRRMQMRLTARRGPDNNKWKGGITPWHNKLLASPEGREWAESVIAKASGICPSCGKSKKLIAHHIFPRKHYPQFAFHPDNGAAICIPCHRHLHGTPPKDEEKRIKWEKQVLVPNGYVFPKSLLIYLES